MSAQPILQALNNMALLHKSLTALSKQKTEIVKKGDVPSLQSLLKEENKHIQAIKKVETQLLSETKLFIQVRGITIDSPNLSDVIEASKGTEKESLLKGKTELEKQIAELSRQNQLNQDLLEQSLQFINVSLDLLQPDIDSYNYNHSESAQPEQGKRSRSLFDSKA